VVGLFIEACCVLVTGGKASAKSLYESYVQWALGAGEKKSLLNQRRFGQKLTERGLKRVRQGGGYFWHGIGLIDTGGVCEVNHFGEQSEPLVNHPNQMVHLPKTAPPLDSLPLSEPSEPLLGDFTHTRENENDTDAHDVMNNFPVYETKEKTKNGSLGSLDAYFPSENSNLQGEPSERNGSPMVHYGSPNGSLDYLHSKLPQGLIHADRKFIEKCLKSFEGVEVSAVLNGYVTEYRRASAAEANDNAKSGSGRRAANAWLRELAERQAVTEYADAE
jgi:hypothetical protein